MAREDRRPTEIQNFVVGDVRAFLLNGKDNEAVALGGAQQMGLDRQIAMIRQDQPLVIRDLGRQRGEA